MTAFIDDHKDRFGVEPICRVLRGHGVKIAPSTSRSVKTRTISTVKAASRPCRADAGRVLAA